MKSGTNFFKKALSFTLLGSLALSLCACSASPSMVTLKNQELTSQLPDESVTGKDPDDTFCSSTAD